jgi:hypothetical protein
MLSLAEISPEEMQQRQLGGLLEKADELIALGKYHDENATGALGIYQQILAIEPENSAAKNGISIVAQYTLLQAQQYINNGDFSRAGINIEIVNAIDPEFPGLKIEAKRLDEIVSIDKNNRQIDLLIARAQSALDNGDLKQAETSVSLAESIDPDKSVIREFRHKINAIRLNDVLTKADTAFANNYYTIPNNKNSYDLYNQALTIAPANLRAKQQIEKIAAYYADKLRDLTQSGNIVSAQRYLGTLETFFPNDPDIPALKQGIRIKQAQIDTSNKAREKQLKQAQTDALNKAREKQLEQAKIEASNQSREKQLKQAQTDASNQSGGKQLKVEERLQRKK